MKITFNPTFSTNHQTYKTNKNISQPNFTARFPDGSKMPKHIKPHIASINFARYNPLTKDFGKYKIPIHNEEISKRLKPQYTSKEFKNLFEFTKSKGTFDYVMDNKTGFVKTSLIKHKENPLMSDLIWVTDTSHNMALVKSKSPNDCTKVLNKISELYEGQQNNFDEVIANPQKYKHNEFWGGATQAGIGHCFVPQTKQPHKWFAKTRLESIGNYMQTTADLIKTGINGGKYGYKTSKDVPDTVINSIANCTKYLKAIHYPTARSCGAWEEQTFANSLTSDTSIINQGMRDVMDIMYSPTDNKELLNIRNRIKSSKHGDVFNDKKGLNKLLKDGEKRIIEQYDVETSKEFNQKSIKPEDKKYYYRKDDSALSFMPQTETLSSDIIKDSTKKLLMLKKLSKSIVKPNGAIRYHNDEYLNLDYHTLKNQWTDNKKKNEAEWFLVSEIANAYGSVADNLLNHIEKTGKDSKTTKLLSIALNGETEHINRSFARITPKNMTKSNGYSCPAYKLPEAYEAVTTRNGRIKYVPGAHSPLTWAESSLYKASEQYLNNLKRTENLGIKFEQ